MKFSLDDLVYIKERTSRGFVYLVKEVNSFKKEYIIETVTPPLRWWNSGIRYIVRENDIELVPFIMNNL